ncbi:hypothetical protein ACMD2_13200 [Ananas comosus]|uniref:Uncharacterized protein n=1 Tax=Ananas comosus TaxID=4615 RepID=A0A199ULH8_ANACO|nr:hypothetical protein ACMD2_13200 [Ananas comosus]
MHEYAKMMLSGETRQFDPFRIPIEKMNTQQRRRNSNNGNVLYTGYARSATNTGNPLFTQTESPLYLHGVAQVQEYSQKTTTTK